MNRGIRFRGQKTGTKEWVYGSLVNNMWTYSELTAMQGQSVCEIITGQYDGDCWEDVICDDDCVVTVINETVGQFTGLLDKNGNEIYEGDILSDEFQGDGGLIISREAVFFDAKLGTWMLDQSAKQDGSYASSLAANLEDFEYTVVGNVYEKTHQSDTMS